MCFQFHFSDSKPRSMRIFSTGSSFFQFHSWDSQRSRGETHGSRLPAFNSILGIHPQIKEREGVRQVLQLFQFHSWDSEIYMNIPSNPKTVNFQFHSWDSAKLVSFTETEISSVLFQFHSWDSREASTMCATRLSTDSFQFHSWDSVESLDMQ